MFSPWGDGELVAKVGGKSFAFIGLEGGRGGVKCGRDAAEAGEWRQRFPGAGNVPAQAVRCPQREGSIPGGGVVITGPRTPALPVASRGGRDLRY